MPRKPAAQYVLRKAALRPTAVAAPARAASGARRSASERNSSSGRTWTGAYSGRARAKPDVM